MSAGNRLAQLERRHDFVLLPPSTSPPARAKPPEAKPRGPLRLRCASPRVAPRRRGGREVKSSPSPGDRMKHCGARHRPGSLRSLALTGTALTCTALTCAAPAVLCRCGVRAACTVPHTVPVSYREAHVCKCGGRAHRPDPAPTCTAPPGTARQGRCAVRCRPSRPVGPGLRGPNGVQVCGLGTQCPCP